MNITFVALPRSCPVKMPYKIPPLKSYLKREFPEHNFEIIDLNIQFNNWVLSNPEGLSEFGNEVVKEKLSSAYQILLPASNSNRKSFTKEELSLINFYCEFYEKSFRALSEQYKKQVKDDNYKVENEHVFFNCLISENTASFICFYITHFSQFDFLYFIAGYLKNNNDTIRLGVCGDTGIFKALGHAGEAFFSLFHFIAHDEPGLLLKDYIRGFPKNREKKVVALKKKKSDIFLNLNDLPLPDYSDIKITEYPSPYIIYPLYISHECKWEKCFFCANTAYKYSRADRSVSNVIKEIEFVNKTYNIRFFEFGDPWIIPEALFELSKNIIKKKLDIRFKFLGRLIDDYDENILKTTYEAGGRYVFWGLESGSQKILDNMNKGTHVETIKRVIKRSHQAGLLNCVFIIVGFPGETEQDLQETKDLLLELKPYIHYVRAKHFILMENTEVNKRINEFHISKVNFLRNHNPHSIPFFYDDPVLNKEVKKRYVDFLKFSEKNFNNKRYLPNNYNLHFVTDPKVIDL
jgi:hypothetical protein